MDEEAHAGSVWKHEELRALFECVTCDWKMEIESKAMPLLLEVPVAWWPKCLCCGEPVYLVGEVDTAAA
jgi:hypothetical protein